MGGVAGAEKERKGLQPKMGFGMMWRPQENRPWTGLCHGGCVVRECIFLAQPVPVTGNVRNRSQGSHHNTVSEHMHPSDGACTRACRPLKSFRTF